MFLCSFRFITALTFQQKAFFETILQLTINKLVDDQFQTYNIQKLKS